MGPVPKAGQTGIAVEDGVLEDDVGARPAPAGKGSEKALITWLPGRRAQDDQGVRLGAGQLTDLSGRCFRCGVARQVRDSLVLGPVVEWVGVDREDPTRSEELADRGEEKRPASRTGSRFDDPVWPKLADQLLEDVEVSRRPVGVRAQPLGGVGGLAVPERVRRSSSSRSSGTGTGCEGRRSSGCAAAARNASALIGRRRVRRAAAGRLPTKWICCCGRTNRMPRSSA